MFSLRASIVSAVFKDYGTSPTIPIYEFDSVVVHESFLSDNGLLIKPCFALYVFRNTFLGGFLDPSVVVALLFLDSRCIRSLFIFDVSLAEGLRLFIHSRMLNSFFRWGLLV